MTNRKKKVEHYLISLPLAEQDGVMRHMHCYLMTTNSRRDMEVAADRMFKIAEEYVHRPLPLFVSTGPLDSKYTKIVRDIIGNEMPEVKENFKTATDFHLTVFIPAPKTDARLMGIH